MTTEQDYSKRIEDLEREAESISIRLGIDIIKRMQKISGVSMLYSGSSFLVQFFPITEFFVNQDLTAGLAAGLATILSLPLSGSIYSTSKRFMYRQLEKIFPDKVEDIRRGRELFPVFGYSK